MPLQEYEHLWTTQLAEWVLVGPCPGEYCIVHKSEGGYSALIIEDDKEARQVIQKMLDAGVEVWDKLPPIGPVSPRPR